MAHPIGIAYLNKIITPVAKINAQYQSILSFGITNHCVKGPLPERLAICVGAKVMLLRNFVVEYKLMNGCVGVVKEIVYKSTSGPANKDELPVYVIVDFPSCTIPLEDALVPNMPPTCVPVPVVMDQCEKKCCSVKTIPLRVCIAISIHKSQGMTIGPGEVFEKVVVYLPEDQREQSPGLELVAFSRAKGPDCLAVGNNSNNLTIMSIQKLEHLKRINYAESSRKS